MKDSSYSSFIDKTDVSTITGNINAMAAGKISYYLNLQGPSMVLDTACSSSLVAIHEGCQSILNEECEFSL